MSTPADSVYKGGGKSEIKLRYANVQGCLLEVVSKLISISVLSYRRTPVSRETFGLNAPHMQCTAANRLFYRSVFVDPGSGSGMTVFP